MEVDRAPFVPGSNELIRSDTNSERLGLIPQSANPRTNPAGLPVGIAKYKMGGVSPQKIDSSVSRGSRIQCGA